MASQSTLFKYFARPSTSWEEAEGTPTASPEGTQVASSKAAAEETPTVESDTAAEMNNGRNDFDVWYVLEIIYLKLY